MSSAFPSFAVVALFFFSLAFAFYTNRKNRRHQSPLPPGPRKLPIIENFLDMPSENAWIEYREMCREYNSDIIQLGTFGMSIIVLNSAKMASDLLEKQSRIYSNRPHSIMTSELMGLFLWETGRFHPKLLEATHDLLRAISRSDDLRKYLHMWAAVVILDIVYGIQGEEVEVYLPVALEALESLDIAGSPGAFYVDQIPLLKYIPEWFPGAGFKRKAKEWDNLCIKMTDTTFNVTKETAPDTAKSSLASVALQQILPTDDRVQQEELIKAVAVTAYLGGTDTTSCALESGILALLMNPDIQTKAHHELDKILGPGDLPSFSDEPSLPYITAIVREILRYAPAFNLGLPHVVAQDDIYEGYLIPKDSIILPNIWSILRNETDYPEPAQFNPSRFLGPDGKINPDVRDPANIVFGFGRRICPGKHIGYASLWIAVASILAGYTIEPALDEKGKPIKPKGQWDPTVKLINHPLPYKCRFLPRSKDVEATLGVNL